MKMQEWSVALTILACSAIPLADALAQTGSNAPNAPKEPADAGAIVVPPSTGDTGALQKSPAPAAVDPGMVAPPRPGKGPQAGHTSPPKATAPGSKDSSCKGPAELCRQSSPK
jgi:hypothetical protein